MADLLLVDGDQPTKKPSFAAWLFSFQINDLKDLIGDGNRTKARNRLYIYDYDTFRRLCTRLCTRSSTRYPMANRQTGASQNREESRP